MAFFISSPQMPTNFRPLIPCLFISLFLTICVLILGQKIGFLDALVIAFIPIGTVIFGIICLIFGGALFLLIAVLFNLLESRLNRHKNTDGQMVTAEELINKKTSKIFVAIRKITMTKPPSEFTLDVSNNTMSRTLEFSKADVSKEIVHPSDIFV